MAPWYPEYTELTAVSNREIYGPLNQPPEIHNGETQNYRLQLKLTLTDAILSVIVHILTGGLLRRSRSSVRV